MKIPKLLKDTGKQVFITLLTIIIGGGFTLLFLNYVLGYPIFYQEQQAIIWGDIEERELKQLQTYGTRFSQTKDIEANETRIATFGLTVEMDNVPDVILYPFYLKLVETKIIEAETERTFNDVILYLPDEFIPEYEIQKDVEVERKERVRLRADPTFKKGDFSEDLPFSEIEITIQRVTIYTDTNETFYETYVRVEENSTEYDIKSLEIKEAKK